MRNTLRRLHVARVDLDNHPHLRESGGIGGCHRIYIAVFRPCRGHARIHFRTDGPFCIGHCTHAGADAILATFMARKDR